MCQRCLQLGLPGVGHNKASHLRCFTSDGTRREEPLSAAAWKVFKAQNRGGGGGGVDVPVNAVGNVLVTQHGGTPPGVAVPAVADVSGAADYGGAASSPQKRRAAVAFASSLAGVSERARRRKLESDDGKLFRRFCRTGFAHQSEKTKSGWCAYCSYTTATVTKSPANTYDEVNRSRRAHGRKTVWKCSLCGVRLCKKKQAGGTQSCFALYHEGCPTMFERQREGEL